jgi:hypothetical protein
MVGDNHSWEASDVLAKRGGTWSTGPWDAHEAVAAKRMREVSNSVWRQGHAAAFEGGDLTSAVVITVRTG